MAYPPHVAFTVNGSMPGGDIWACTIRTANPDLPNEPFGGLDLADAAEDALTAWKAFFSTSVLLAVGQSIAGVRAVVYGTNGQPVEQANSSGASLVGNTAQKLPNQIALCITFQGQDQRRRGRGRVYLPVLTNEYVAADLGLPAGARGAYASAMSDLLEGSINWGYAAPANGYGPAVVSSTYGSATLIRSVRIGNVYDTQRRRRNALVETYSSAPVTQTNPVD